MEKNMVVWEKLKKKQTMALYLKPRNFDLRRIKIMAYI